MTVTEQLENLEINNLSPFASFSKHSKGRENYEQECNFRTKYQRDIDRIVYSKAFRRLKHKTQVFISPEGDHYRTRLTHTLEVSQIARTIARALRLNENLTEAIALGHDLGHTPFGHAGEAILDKICPYGFKHNIQSLRVVESLEKGIGLNLTFEVRDGIKRHTGDELPVTLEGQIVRYADRIAYLTHDIDDAIRAGLLTEDSLPAECVKILGRTSTQRINNMTVNIIKNSNEKNVIWMDAEFKEAKDELRQFMFKHVYVDSLAKKDEIKAQNVLKELYFILKDAPTNLPSETFALIKNNDIDRVVCDYVAGMTDRYAIRRFQEIFVPASWSFGL